MRTMAQAALRVGIGFDVHRLAAGRPLILGGVPIPYARGLEGDSDGDALTHAILDALLGAAAEAAAAVGAAVAAVPVTDTIKVAGTDRLVQETPARGKLWAAQTPQAFRAGLLREAHERALRDGYRGTDDSVLVERLGHPVQLVPGAPENLKITTLADLALAEQILRGQGQEEP